MNGGRRLVPTLRKRLENPKGWGGGKLPLTAAQKGRLIENQKNRRAIWKSTVNNAGSLPSFKKERVTVKSALGWENSPRAGLVGGWGGGKGRNAEEST